MPNHSESASSLGFNHPFVNKRPTSFSIMVARMFAKMGRASKAVDCPPSESEIQFSPKRRGEHKAPSRAPSPYLMITRDSLIIHGPPAAKEKAKGNSLYLISINTVGPYLTPVLQDVVHLKLLSGEVTVALDDNNKAVVLSAKVPSYTVKPGYTGALYITVSGPGFGQILVTTGREATASLSKKTGKSVQASLPTSTPNPGETGTHEPDETLD